MNETLLQISIAGFPPMSARNCVQELFPIPAGAFYRDVNGKLVFLGEKGVSKYRTVISCKDANLPAFSGIYVGEEVEVASIQYIWKKVDEKVLSVRLDRTPVEGSIIVVDNLGNDLDFSVASPVNVTINGNESGCYVGFRPHMKMTIVDFSTETDEWGMESKWKLVMEEI